MPRGLIPYQPDVKNYWNKEKAIGVIERNGRFTGIACLAAKEVTNK